MVTEEQGGNVRGGIGGCTGGRRKGDTPDEPEIDKVLQVVKRGDIHCMHCKKDMFMPKFTTFVKRGSICWRVCKPITWFIKGHY